MKVLVTGGKGFIGRNLVAHLQSRNDCEILGHSSEESLRDLDAKLLVADTIFHFAGVNRPLDPLEFEAVNLKLTEHICQVLLAAGRSPKIIFSSSIQAEFDTPYGISKAQAELALQRYASKSQASIKIYRLGNVFGKWCRPNYNSVTATFCHNIARDLPIFVSDPNHAIELSYIDDVIAAFIKELSVDQQAESAVRDISKYKISLGDLAGRIQAFHEMRETLLIPDFSDWFNRALYATYLSYVPPEVQLYSLNVNSDTRGSLAEFIKGQHFGQVFVSRTKSGITRGNHYHHTKTEKFFVVEGEGLIRMRPIEERSIVEHFVKGSSYQIVDIPPGFTHSISNVGEGEMVTLFWSSEIFNPNQPDTYYLPVAPEEIKQMVS